MAWRIGIDEAGYGPNLGPLVMTAVACRLPDELAEADLWQTLADGVRRERLDNDHRLLIDDSKLVYSAARGLTDLEKSVLSFLCGSLGRTFPLISEILSDLCLMGQEETAKECWFHGGTSLPLACEHQAIQAGAEIFQRTCSLQQLQWGPVRAVVVCPSRFNDLLDHWGSKAAVLAISMADLLRRHLDHNGTEPLCVVIDKHGGRNYYSALLQEAVGSAMTWAREESAERSIYEVTGLDHPMRVTFMPRADAGDLCVALASMISKYLRELLMAEFNEFWRRHLPELVPTAGYHNDAARFFADIEPVRRRLKIADRHLWRQR